MIPRLATCPLQPEVPVFAPNAPFYELYETRYEKEYGVFWALARATAPRRFTLELLETLLHGQHEFRERIRRQQDEDIERINYQVLGSQIPGVFSYGGDLALFRELIKCQDAEGLRDYAISCIDVVYTNATNYELPVTTISLIQGDALGGGFEAALAANVVVAERGCKMGLPEILFNLFPGMGAYQLLTQRMSPKRAELFITEGKTYLSDELFEMGLVDILVDAGQGVEAVHDYVAASHHRLNGMHAVRESMRESGILSYEQLQEVADIWVECALRLTAKNLEVIDYLIQAQTLKHAA